MLVSGLSNFNLIKENIMCDEDMAIKCPKCGSVNEIEKEDLPAYSIDTGDYCCQFCEHVFGVGWKAQPEIRYTNIPEDEPKVGG